jgi:glutamate dehydrogenase (NAD(P)+)
MVEIEYDELGPAKVMHFYSGRRGFRAIVVVDNTARGPSIGGVRVSSSVTTDEVRRLARTMTMKNSLAGIPHGGGKAGIIADPKDPRKEEYFRILSRIIKDMTDYIPGPDMGSDETAMAWVYDETGRAVGLPEEIGGLPLDRLGATGRGLAECAEVACPHAGVELKGARVAIQGFGSVGKAAAKCLSLKGAIIVAASDTKGCIHKPDGMDVGELIEIKESTGSVANYKKGCVKKTEELFLLDCDVLIPAAIPDAINNDNVGGVKAKLILQGANIPVTRGAEEALHNRGVLSIPDCIANAGGVIMAAMEYARKNEKEAFELISMRIKTNTEMMLKRSEKMKMLPRQAAEEIARDRVLKAMSYKGY